MKLNKIDDHLSKREKIDDVRRNNGIIHLILIMLPIGALVYAIMGATSGRFLLFAVCLIMIIFIAAILERRDKCPTCRKHIAFLPSERSLLLPRLSRKIKVCPFCGIEFDNHGNDAQQAGADESTAAPQPKSPDN